MGIGPSFSSSLSKANSHSIAILVSGKVSILAVHTSLDHLCFVNFCFVRCREARLSLLHLHTEQTSMSLSENEWQELASATEGYSGSDIANIVADSLMEPVREMETAKYWKPVAC